jgi:transposase-like protein
VFTWSAPVARREHRQRFWEAIALGLSSEDAAVVAGVSPPVGTRWFREAGGMPSVSLAPESGRYLSFAEREELAILCAQGGGVRETARRLGRSPSTISRELRRNAATRGGGLEYRATTAQWHADRRASRPKVAKLAANDGLRKYVPDRLGAWSRPCWHGCVWSGGTVDRPAARAPQGSSLGECVEPGADANRLRVDFPQDASMRISHEAIYQALYVQGRGALRRELTAVCAPGGRCECRGLGPGGEARSS